MTKKGATGDFFFIFAKKKKKKKKKKLQYFPTLFILKDSDYGNYEIKIEFFTYKSKFWDTFPCICIS